MIKLIDEQTFDLVSVGYTGTSFPNPEDNLLSRMADEKNTNNLTGFKNPRVDQLIEMYNKEFSMDERIKILREIDGIVTNEHHWILEWTAPYQRVVYWHKFGQPQGILTRVGDVRDIPSMWWIDPEKAAKLQEAMRDSSIQLGEGQTEDRYWLEFARVEEQEKNPVTQ
jgi:microcin C transport system substrate-binding protein